MAELFRLANGSELFYVGDPFFEVSIILFAAPPLAGSLAEAEAGAALVATAARLRQRRLVAAGPPVEGRDSG